MWYYLAICYNIVFIASSEIRLLSLRKLSGRELTATNKKCVIGSPSEIIVLS
jgi:hypothetical protein